MILFKFDEQGVECAEVVGGGVGVQVQDGGQAEAEEQVMCCSTRLVAWVEGRQASEVGFGEEECIEPVYSTFMTAIR